MNAFPAGGNFGGSPIDNIKQMMMSMFMVKSLTGTGQEENNKSFSVLYGILIIGIIEKIIEKGLPYLSNIINSYFNDKMKNITEKLTETTTKTPEPQSLITFKASFLTTGQSIVSEAIIDYATNLPNIKKVLYMKNIYLINSIDPVCIDETNQIYIKLDKKVDLTSGSEEQKELFQVVNLYSYDLNINELRKYVNKIVTDYTIKIQNKLGDKLFYFDAIPCQVFKDSSGAKDYSKLPPIFTFTMKTFITNRKFTNVVGKESKLIEKRVNFFKNNKKWYDSKGIPYTLGLLLSGPPGGGKTSTIKCVANETQRHIINIKLTDDITKTQLENLFFNETIHVLNNGKTEQFTIPMDKRVYVFEDVDCQSSNIVIDRKILQTKNKEEQNKNKEKSNTISPGENTNVKTQPKKKADNPTLETDNNSEKLSLSCLLNAFDGILETPGRIIIMTSNYPEMLDKALIRPGRIDLICQFKKCDSNMIVEFIEKFYDIALNEEEIEIINNIPEEKLTPAEVTKFMFENFNDYKSAIYAVKEYSKNSTVEPTPPPVPEFSFDQIYDHSENIAIIENESENEAENIDEKKMSEFFNQMYSKEVTFEKISDIKTIKKNIEQQYKIQDPYKGDIFENYNNLKINKNLEDFKKNSSNFTGVESYISSNFTSYTPF